MLNCDFYSPFKFTFAYTQHICTRNVMININAEQRRTALYAPNDSTSFLHGVKTLPYMCVSEHMHVYVYVCINVYMCMCMCKPITTIYVQEKIGLMSPTTRSYHIWDTHFLLNNFFPRYINVCPLRT